VALAETANLVVKLSLGGNFTSQIGKATAGLGKLEKGSSRAYKAGAQIGIGIKNAGKLAAAGVGLLATQVAFGLDQLIQLESATAQTNAVIKSTKGAAGQTAASIRNLSEKLEGLNATIDDKVIQSGANVLLTFTEIRKEAFEPALLAALDMSTALKKDLQPSILQIGKALQDPIGGLTALKKSGVNVTEALKDQIAAQFELTKEERDHYTALRRTDKGAAKRYKESLRQVSIQKAQKIILKELNTEFGGSFLAGGATTAGKVAKFGDAIEDLQKSLAVALLPAVSNIADALNTLLRDESVIKSTEKLGQQIGKLFSPGNIKAGIGALKEGFNAIKAIAGPIADVVGTLVKTFTSLPPDIQKLLVGGFAVNKLTGGLITNVFGGIAEAIAKSFIKTPLVNVTGGVVNVAGGGLPGGKGGIPGGIGGALGGAGLALTAGTVVLAAGTVAVGASLVQGLIDPVGSGARGRANAGRAATASARGIPDSNNKPLNAITNASKTESRATLQVEQAAKRGLAQVVAANAKVQTGIESMKSRLATELVGTTNAERETRREAARGAAFGAQGITATTSGAATVAAAVRASRPIITVNVSSTSITRVTEVTKRYGNPLASRNIRQGAN
jgi:hypothetical protein